MASENDTPTQHDDTVGDSVRPQNAAASDAADETAAAPKRAPRKRASRAASAGATSGTITETTTGAAAAKKTARKTAPRASRKKAAPAETAQPIPAASAGAQPSEYASPAPAAKKAARKRAGRKATAPTAPPAPAEEPVDATDPAFLPTLDISDTVAVPMAADDDDVDEVITEGETPAGADFGVLFQAPSVPPARRSRRASSPAKAAAPAPAAGDASPIRPTADDDALTVGTPPSGDGAQTPGREASAHVGADADAGSAGADPGEADDSSEEGDAPRRRRRRGGKGRRGRGADTDDHSELSESGQGTDGTDGAEDTASGGSSGASEASSRDQTPRSGGRRRGRSAGSKAAGSDGGSEAAADQSHSDVEPGDHEDSDSGAESGDESGAGSRRRTRRRRRSGSGGEGDDAPNVTTRVREPRRGSDEVTGVKGSTRLEAKKQRRREGREAGRRRTIITEAEFLARRESVERVMAVRHKDDRTQIGVLEDGVLVEHYISRETNVSMAGNIYLGRVQNVLPSMEAAFVDIGKGRNAVLYAGEVNWDAAGLESGQPKRIEHALGSGQSVLVQVTKDPIGHKGARLTSQISLPGRYLVYVPESSMTGISRKLPDTERARLKRILKEVVPASAGVIVRTAAEGASEEELRADVARLTATWEEISAMVEAAGGRTKAKGKAKATGSAPTLLHGEPDLTVRVIRDVFTEDFASLVVAGEQAWDEVSDYVGSVAPDLAGRITRWTSEEDLFTHYRIDEQISKAMDRKVWLPSGGSLVIDRTEAMTVIDVNTGKFVGSGGNLEETVTKNNIEAAEEIVRQLRLRDIGGIIVVDFIDMVLEANRDLVVRRLLECLGRDRTKHQVAEVTSLGLVQMTRKRVGSGLIEVFSETCEHCAGRGVIVHADPVDRSNSSPHADTHAAAPSQPAVAARPGRRRGKGLESTPAPVAAAAPQRAGGPTPAQIAAAAHAAALKVASGTDNGEDAGFADLDGHAPVQPDLSAVPEHLGESVAHAVTEAIEQAEVDGQLDVEDRDATASAHAGREAAPASEVSGSGPVSVGEPVSASADEPGSEPVDEPDPYAAPAPRPRRRRGRVVAPAGPPRGADASSSQDEAG